MSETSQISIILASQSLQRKLLVEALNLDFEVQPADIDERAITAQDHQSRAARIAAEKGAVIQRQRPDSIVIAADTFVVLDGKTLEKPLDLEEARSMLSWQSGREITVYTGYYYLDPRFHRVTNCAVVATATFRAYTQKEIDQYVQANPVLSWAGAFSIAYPAGSTLVDKVNGSFTSLVYGLPITILCDDLKLSGLI